MNDQFEERIERLRKALGWYAEIGEVISPDGLVRIDNGSRVAKKALAADAILGAGGCHHCANLGVMHSSDCAVHNEPAMPNGSCDCGAITT